MSTEQSYICYRWNTELAKVAMIIETIILSKDKFKTKKDAKKWIKDHKFSSHKVDETTSFFRFQQRDPAEFDKKTFRTITLTEGVKAVVGKLKNK